MSPLMTSLIIGICIATVILTITAWSIWYERKFAGRIQNRPGPTEVGSFGLLQPLADVLKLMQKEDVIPRDADRALFNLAPPLTIVAALGLLAVVPFSPEIVVSDLDVGLLFILAIGSVMVLPVWMAGWASNNKYAMLGAMRAISQSISYEVPLLMSAMVPVILAGSYNMGDIVEAQSGWQWFAFWPVGPGAIAFVLFFLCSLAEANRIPFDIPEAESELVAGVTTEYCGMKFGMFYLAEYLHTLISSAIASVLFLGGWEGPGPDGLHWMMVKTLLLFALIFWVRWTILRYRQDQLIKVCWVYFLPLSLVLVAVSAVWKAGLI